jgi:hypothetical protein
MMPPLVTTAVARGNRIEFDEPLPFADGQKVRVSVEPLSAHLRRGSAAAILRAVHSAPHLDSADVDELERLIEEGKLSLATVAFDQ